MFAARAQVYPSAERGARSAAREYGGSGRVRLGGVPNALRRIDHDKLLTTIKVASPDNDGVYVFLLKALTLYGLEVGAPGSGLDARDVFFAQGDKYGASYADVFRAIPHKARAMARLRVRRAAPAYGPVGCASPGVRVRRGRCRGHGVRSGCREGRRAALTAAVRRVHAGGVRTEQ